MKKISLIKSKKFDLVLIMTMELRSTKSIIKYEIIVITQGNLEELLIVFAIYKCKTPKEISIVFHNGCKYDYHFIINQLPKEFDNQLECLGENTENYITFSVPISKVPDNCKTITYKSKFIDSFRFKSI